MHVHVLSIRFLPLCSMVNKSVIESGRWLEKLSSMTGSQLPNAALQYINSALQAPPAPTQAHQNTPSAPSAAANVTTSTASGGGAPVTGASTHAAERERIQDDELGPMGAHPHPHPAESDPSQTPMDEDDTQLMARVQALLRLQLGVAGGDESLARPDDVRSAFGQQRNIH